MSRKRIVIIGAGFRGGAGRRGVEPVSISKADFKKLLGAFPELSSEISRVMEARQ